MSDSLAARKTGFVAGIKIGRAAILHGEIFAGAPERHFKAFRQNFFRTAGDHPGLFAFKRLALGFVIFRQVGETVEENLHWRTHGIPIDRGGEDDPVVRQHRLHCDPKIIAVIGMGIVIAADMMMGEDDKIGIAGKGNLHRPPGLAIGPRAAQNDKRLHVYRPTNGSLHHDGVVAVGAGGEQRHRRADQLFHPADIFDGIGGKLGPAARALGGFAPAFQRFIDRLQPRLFDWRRRADNPASCRPARNGCRP